MNRHASINRVYRLIWSKANDAWVPVAETAKGGGKSGQSRSYANRNGLAAAILLALSPLTHAAPPAAPCVATACAAPAVSATNHPLGAQVISGTASITQSGNTTNIRQSSNCLSIDWLSFNVGSQASVDFIQPSASAVAVNRISGSNGSEILGHIEANGQVWLINPDGVVFGPGSVVDVGGLVASTLDVAGSGIKGNASVFAGNGTGSVINQGTIEAGSGGYVALLANHVSNQGVISAELGTVALGAGSAATLTFAGNSLLKMQVDRSTLDNLAANGGLIQADGGQVLMSAGAANALLASVVNNTGVIEARTVANHNGTIELLGGMTAGAVIVGGTLDASAPDGGNGGFIETSAAQVGVANNTKVTTAAPKGLYGTWLVDPTDFTVAPNGGDVTGATLSSDLNSTNFTILSSTGTSPVTGGGSGGNINVNDTVSWSANTTLTLTAANNVNVNGIITASGATAGLAIKPNTANGSEMASGAGTFNLGAGATINLPNVAPASTTALVIGGTPYTVINTLGASGSTSGQDLQGINGSLAGHYALGSNIDATATSGWNAGAGFTPIGNSTTAFTGSFNGLGHTISNLTINLPAANYVGLFGLSSGTIANIGVAGGSVTGLTYVGGLAGYNSGGSIGKSYATDSVRATDDFDGGLVGYNTGSISNSYATGFVNSSNSAGGLVAYNGGSIINSYATGEAFGNEPVGGLVGYNSGSISNSYATGEANGSVFDGGLVGFNYGGSISNSYATGAVYGANIGGLVGFNNGGPVSNSYWDTQSSGEATSSHGGTGLTTAQMQNASSFTGWSISSAGGSGGVWRIYQGDTFPLLLNFMTPLTLANTIVTYNGSAQSGAATALSGIFGAPSSGINVGIYNAGYYSDQEGYDISGGALTINQLASVTWTGGTSGGWSKPSNWAGGALPDLSNVAAVTIPKNTTVTYDSGVVGTTILSSLTDSGKLVMAAGNLSVTGNLSTGGYSQSGGLLNVGGTLSINAGGGVTLGDVDAGTLIVSAKGAIGQLAGSTLDVTGTASLTAMNGATAYSITFAQPTDSFGGEVSANGLNIRLLDTSSNGLTLGNTSATGTLTDTSKAGAITQAAATAIDVTGAASLTAYDGLAVRYGITLANTTNNFVGTVSLNGANIALVDDTGGLVLGKTTASGTFSADSLAGPITQAPTTGLVVTGASSLTAANNDITLASATNNFVGAVSSNGRNVTLEDKTGGIIVGNTTATGNLSVTSLGGSITQASTTALNVAGTSTLTADNGATGPSENRYAVKLAQAGDRFAGAVTAKGSAITLSDKTALTAALDSSGAATLTAAGNLDVSGTVLTTLTTTTTGTGHTTTFGATSVGRSLNVTSTGAVTETAADILTVAGLPTTSAPNPHVCVNGTCDVEITAP